MIINMREQKLKIYYDSQSVNSEMEKAIEKLLKKYNYKFEGSGYDLAKGIRDLAFYKKDSKI